MKSHFLVLATVLIATATVSAETHIAGDIHAMNLDETGNPYIVEQDIFVPAGKKAAIKEGCVFLFKNFTGLNVQGQIAIEGSSAKPVIFTSVNDGDHNPQSEQLPNSFDWNGILITRESPGTAIKHIQLKYSVYGIKAQNPNITILNGTFYQNGQFHFTINDKIQNVQDNIPFSFDASNPGAQNTGGSQNVSAGSSSRQSAPVIAQPKRKTSSTTLAVRYTCLGVGVIGLGVGAVYTFFTAQDDVNLKQYVQLPTNGANNSRTDYDNLLAKFNSDRLACIVGYSLGVLGLVGFGVTFAF